VAGLSWRVCGVETLAILESDYHAPEDVIRSAEPVLTGSVHHLERGDETLVDRPMIIKLAEVVTEFLSDSVTNEENEEMNIPFLKVSSVELNVEKLAVEVGKVETTKTLPNGRVVTGLDWSGEDLKLTAGVLHNISGQLPALVDINGRMPGFLALHLVHEVHPSHARINSPDGFVGIGCLKPEGAGRGCGWEIRELGKTESGRRMVWVEYTLSADIPFNPADLETVAPPEIEMGDVVVLSGRGPLWAMASVGMSYHGTAAAVAPWQPGVGATVSWTHVADVELGHLFEV